MPIRRRGGATCPLSSVALPRNSVFIVLFRALAVALAAALALAHFVRRFPKGKGNGKGMGSWAKPRPVR